jgi:LysR family transcriptional regulator, malonate utilization transcriptional regulator
MKVRIDDEITFRKLEIFSVFMKQGNLGRTSELLDISAVSVHRALHSLEEGLRCQLFRHEGRNLSPTPAAFLLEETAREVLDRMVRGVSATRAAAGFASGQFRLGSIYSLTTRVVPQVIMEIKLRRPELQIDLVLGSNADLLAKLRNSQVDAALMGLPRPANDLQTIPLFEDDIYFALPAGDPKGQREEIDLREFADANFVSLSEGFATSESFNETFRLAGYAPNLVTRVGDIYTLMNLVAGGVGYTLLPGRVREVLGDRVRLLPLSRPYRLRQTIGLAFMRVRERDPNVLALSAVCRGGGKAWGRSPEAPVPEPSGAR